MKTFATILILSVSSLSYSQNPAIMELNSTDQGFLPPVMTKIQMTEINSPVEGLMVYCTDCKSKGPHSYNGSWWIGPDNLPHDLSPTDVYSPATGKVWMDRNLGASRVATSSTDTDSYGYLYQWGRSTDGHQIRTSGTTSTLSNTDTPGHGDFILAASSPYDWRNTQNNDLWQGTSGINNPCPTGYRLPTEAEWEAERLSWGSNNNAAGAFASPLKLPMAGSRADSNGSLGDVGTVGGYWSSTVSGMGARSLIFSSSFASLYTFNRANGFSVRCIKD